jgi:hypothetical protein
MKCAFVGKERIYKAVLFAATYFGETRLFSGSLYTNIRTKKHTIPYKNITLYHKGIFATNSAEYIP